MDSQFYDDHEDRATTHTLSSLTENKHLTAVHSLGNKLEAKRGTTLDQISETNKSAIPLQKSHMKYKKIIFKRKEQLV